MHGLLWFFGVYPTPPGTSPMYQLWSGFLPALMVLSLLGSLTAVLRSMNCHVSGCPRIGRYRVAGGRFRVCARHHPDERLHGTVTHAHVIAAHREHEDTASC